MKSKGKRIAIALRAIPIALSMERAIIKQSEMKQRNYIKDN